MKIDIEHHILTIHYKEDNPTAAENSLAVLYDGYKLYVYNLIKKNLYRELHKEEIALSITNDVFFHIYEKTPDWNFDKKRNKTEDGAFKAYLATVAYFKIKEAYKAAKGWSREDLTFDDDHSLFDEGFSQEELEILDTTLSKNHLALEEILNSFSDRDKHIILTYFQHFEEGKKLPTKVLNSLEELHQTNRANIRKVISRAKKKIKEMASTQKLKIS